jgi:hypothetical protein
LDGVFFKCEESRFKGSVRRSENRTKEYNEKPSEGGDRESDVLLDERGFVEKCL